MARNAEWAGILGAAHKPQRSLGKTHISVNGLSIGLCRARPVTSGARFAHALFHGISFKAGRMAIGANITALLAPPRMDQMELLLQTELRGRTGQVFARPLRLRDTAPGPLPVVDRIAKRSAVRRLERLVRFRRYKSASVTMATRAGDICNEGRPEFLPVMFTMAVRAGQSDFHVNVGNIGLKCRGLVTSSAILVQRGGEPMALRTGVGIRCLRDRRHH